MLSEGNQIHRYISSSGSGTVINYGSGSGQDFITSYGSDSASWKLRFRFHNTAHSWHKLAVGELKERKNKALMIAVEADEELSPTFEELILLTCLYSWDARIPRKVTRDIFNSVPCSDNEVRDLQMMNPGYALGDVWCAPLDRFRIQASKF